MTKQSNTIDDWKEQLALQRHESLPPCWMIPWILRKNSC